VEECLLALRGEGPADLMEVSYALGVEMLLSAGVESTGAAARSRLEATIASGDALQKLGEIVEAQGGNPAVAEDPALLPQAPESAVFHASRGGAVTAVLPRPIGHGVIAMGGGRSRVEDTVDPSVGFVITVRPGDRVEAGQPLATVYARDAAGLAAGAAALTEGIRIDEGAASPLPLVSHRVTAAGAQVF